MTLSCKLPWAAAVLPVAALAISACDSAPSTDEENVAAVEPETPTLQLPVSVPGPEPEMDRAAVLAAVARAASAHAAGQDDSDQQSKLAGRRFTLSIRFGCSEAEGLASRPMSWNYVEAEQRLTIRAEPDITADISILEEAGHPVEAVEGFWIPRPWLLTDACPAGAPEAVGDAGEVDGAEPTVGIAQYFTSQDSRVQRRARRSYEIVRRAEPAIAPPSGGFNLVLSGRLKPWPSSGVILCRVRGRDVRPACIVSAELDRIAFENPENGWTVAEWSAG